VGGTAPLCSLGSMYPTYSTPFSSPLPAGESLRYKLYSSGLSIGAMWIAYALLSIKGDRVLAYTWSIHACGTGLVTFSPKKNIISHPLAFSGLPLLSLLGICIYAWKLGPPVGVVPWANGDQAQCGWVVHLTSVLGSDLLADFLSPLGNLLWAIS